MSLKWRRLRTALEGRDLAADISFVQKVVSYRSGKTYTAVPIEEKWRIINQRLWALGKVSQGNTFTPYYDSGDAYRSMWDAVDAAKEEVRWQTYICKDDNVGRTTVAKLEAAADRGVRVELLYDCGGNITGRSRLTGGLRSRSNEDNTRVQVHVHRPFFAAMWNYLKGGMRWQDSPALRNHRKILVTDRSEAFVGGLNIGDDYCAVAVGGNGRFRDTQCRVCGPAVKDILEVFDDTLQPTPVAPRSEWSKLLSPVALDSMQRATRAAGRNLQRGGQSIVSGLRHLGASTSRTFRSEKDKKRLTQIRNTVSGLYETSSSYAKGSPEERAALRKSIRAKLRSRAGAMQLTPEEQHALVERVKAKASLLRARLFERVSSNAQLRLDELRLLGVEASRGYFPPCDDTQPIPEVIAFKDTPSTTQIMGCNPLTRDWTIPMTLTLITKGAHRRVWVTTPYYLPHQRLTAAVISAARRGVDVRVIAGSYSTTDPWFMWYASQHVTMRLLRAGVRIYEFEGGQIMHAKTVVVDSVWCSVGSYNWDVLSNKLLEASVTTFGVAEASEMEDHFRRDLARSKELTIDRFQSRSLFLKFKCAFFYYGMRFGEKLGFWDYIDRHLSTSVDPLKVKRS